MRRSEGQAAVLSVVPGFDARTAQDLLADASGWLLNLSGPELDRPVEQLRRCGILSESSGVLRISEPLRSDLRATLARESPEVFSAAVESLRPHAGNGFYQALSRMLGKSATDLHLAILEVQAAPEADEARNALIKLLQEPQSIARGVDPSIAARQLATVGAGRPHVDRMMQFVRGLDLWRAGKRGSASDLFKTVLRAGSRDLAQAISGHLLGVFLVSEGNLAVAEGNIEDSIAILRDLHDDHGLAMALTSLGRALRLQAAVGDQDSSARNSDQLLLEAAAALTEATEIQAAQGDSSGLAHAYYEFARVRELEGDLDGAIDLALISLDAARLPDGRLESLILLGGLYRDAGLSEEANSYLEDATGLAREARISSMTLARILNVQASVERRAGRYGAAISHARESLRVGQELGNRRHIAHAQHTLAASLLDADTPQSTIEAARLLRASLRSLRAMGDGPGEAMVLRTLSRVADSPREKPVYRRKPKQKPE